MHKQKPKKQNQKIKGRGRQKGVEGQEKGDSRRGLGEDLEGQRNVGTEDWVGSHANNPKST